ncbi:MAG: sporulation protein YqfD, partial [Peptococcaceae bacterium]|nr:sporulation protein YqfD [Peptococcaceae bacterium]
LPFWLGRLKRRKFLAAGFVLFIGALYVLSSFAWTVEVKGNQRLDSAQILAVAAEAGLRRGMPKWMIDQAAVEATIEERLPLVAWVGVSMKGTRVTIEVSEKVVPEEKDRRPAHVVAGKAGIISELLVFEGHPAVKTGDTVLPGQVLISGAIPPPEEPQKPKDMGKPEAVKKPRLVHARGIVRARVWYEKTGEALVVETFQKPTGRQVTRYSMKFGDKEIILASTQNIPFEQYETEISIKKLPSWRNLELPVELVTLKYVEMAGSTEVRGIGGARRLAGETALAALREELPPAARIVASRLEDLPGGVSGNLVRVKAVLEAIEDIGREEIFDSH